ncbi:MAG TPA: hypothetical protein VH186_26465 [Chloroflexia bacterium]|nr:hypothetical protein [Chloroflexia bacterium]
MNAIAYIFSRKLEIQLRRAYAILGYEPGSEELSEKLYGLYLIVILLVWTICMLAWFVFTLGNILSQVKVASASLEQGYYIILGVALAATPVLAYRGYDLYKFQLADIEFLSSAPLGTRLVAFWWFVRSLVKIWVGIFIIVCGLAGSTGSYIQHGNDWLGLLDGTIAAIFYILIFQGVRWVLGLLHYYPVDRYKAVLAYGLSALGIILVVLPVVLPVSKAVLWPAGITAWLVAGGATTAGNELMGLYATLVLVLTGIVIVWALVRIAGGSRLAPAFEEGWLGGQYRLTTGAGGMRQEAQLQMHLGRKMQRNQALATTTRRGTKVRTGVVEALLFKEGIRIRRLPYFQGIFSIIMQMVAGGGVALGLAALTKYQGGFVLAVQIAFFANWSLIKLGCNPLRRELSHPDFFVGWPISRIRLMSYELLAGFGPATLSGEICLLVASATGLGASAIYWMMLWPLLMLLTAMIALVEFRRLLRHWAATPETVPETGIGIVLLSGIIWLIVALVGPSTGTTITLAIVFSIYYFLRQSVTSSSI